MQESTPWEDATPASSRQVLLTCARALRAVAVMLWPVMPVFADDLASAFGQSRPAAWTPDFDPFAGPPVVARRKPPQIARLDAKQVARLVAPPEAEPARVAAAQSPAETASKVTARPAPAPAAATPPGSIQYDDFAKVELKVALVRAAERVPKADKLLRLTLDVGEGTDRTIVAGVAVSYPDPAALVGRRIVVVANLEPRALRGITSQGMLLAAGDPPKVLFVDEGVAPGTRVK